MVPMDGIYVSMCRFQNIQKESRKWPDERLGMSDKQRREKWRLAGQMNLSEGGLWTLKLGTVPTLWLKCRLSLLRFRSPIFTGSTLGSDYRQRSFI